jgi:hypothetical protein
MWYSMFRPDMPVDVIVVPLFTLVPDAALLKESADVSTSRACRPRL